MMMTEDNLEILEDTIDQILMTQENPANPTKETRTEEEEIVKEIEIEKVHIMEDPLTTEKEVDTDPDQEVEMC